MGKPVGIVATLAALALAYYSARLWFQESTYTGRGTYAYWLLVPGTLRNAPEVGVAGSPRFYSTPGDGQKLPQNELTYESDAPEEHILATSDAYLQGLGYSRQGESGDPRTRTYSDRKSLAEVRLTPIAGGRWRVTITITY